MTEKWYKEDKDAVRLMEFIAAKVEDRETRGSTHQLAKDYKQEYRLKGTIVSYKNKLKREAIVEVDIKNHITTYQSFDGSLNLSIRKTRQSAAPVILTDPDHMMLQLLGEMARDATDPLVDDKFIEEFSSRTNDRDNLRRLRERYEAVKKSISKSNAYDNKMKARMVFASNASVDRPFLIELQKEATVLVDEQGKIIEYKSNDGAVTLRNMELLRLRNQKIQVARAAHQPPQKPPQKSSQQPPQQPPQRPAQQPPQQPPQRPAQQPPQPPPQQPAQEPPQPPPQKPAQHPPVTLKQEPEPEIEIPPDEDDPAPAPDVPMNEQALYLIQDEAAAAAAANAPGPAPPVEQNNNAETAATRPVCLALVKHEPQTTDPTQPNFEVAREFIANYQTIIAACSPGFAQAREVLKWLNYFILDLNCPLLADLKEKVEAAIRACGVASRPIAIDGVLTCLGTVFLVIVKTVSTQQPIPEDHVQINKFLLHIPRAFQYFQWSQAAYSFRQTFERVNQDLGQLSFPKQSSRSVLETVLTLAS
ncbi:hypothetical protein CAEBREN_01155 [Caenorhabditis brenneri]|uniref:SPK domain-containing protein n=1 Tax=Caenorhabditis brenneri TaxID=135651 RepID=G0PA22_CAEBE|nr:hypothetical protein CAEBREN_01155 [Caenorhabditis brenneri]